MLVPRFPELDHFPIVMSLELRDDEVNGTKGRLSSTEASQRAAELQPEVGLQRRIHCASLASPSMRDHPALADFVKAQLSKGLDFKLLRIAVSLKPAPDTTLPSVRVEVALGRHNDLQPTVYWVLPANLRPDRARETELQIKPDLRIGSEKVEISAGHWIQREKIGGQDFRIIGYFRDPSAIWTLEGRDGGVSGSWELWLIAEWPRGLESVPVAVTVNATVLHRTALLFTRRSMYRYDEVYRAVG
jgi:hypothetical protein